MGVDSRLLTGTHHERIQPSRAACVLLGNAIAQLVPVMLSDQSGRAL